MVFGLFQKRSFKQFRRTVLFSSLVLTGIVVVTRQLGAFEAMELGAYDHPIKDGTLAELLEKLEANEPRVIGIDIARDIPIGPEDGRNRLASIIENSDRIISGCLLSSEKGPGDPGSIGIAPGPGAPRERIGFADFSQDVGGVVRRHILFSVPGKPPVKVDNPHECNNYEKDEDDRIDSLGFTLSLKYLNREKHKFGGEKNLKNYIDNIILNHRIFNHSGGYISSGASNDHQLMLNYRSGENAIESVSATKILEETVDDSLIKDRIVLIGYTTQLAKDVVPTPYHETIDGGRWMPGVMVHAQAASQITSAVLDARPLIQSWSEPVEIVWIWMCALMGGSLAFYNRRLSVFLISCIALMAVYWSICFILFFTQGLWLPMVPSIIAFVFAAASVGIIDQANQRGYAVAIYEQLKDQLAGTAAHESAQKADYFESLVQRARAVRQRRTGEALWNNEAMANFENDPDKVTFASPEMQAIYDQIKAKAQKALESKRAELESEQKQRKMLDQTTRVEALIGKSRAIRRERKKQ